MASHLLGISILLNLDQALARDRATSRAIPGRRIGRADGLDLAFPGHFAKKSSNLGHFAKKTSIFCEKVLELRPFCKKALDILQKKSSNLGHFAKKSSNFLGIPDLAFPSHFEKKSSSLGHFAKKIP